MLAPMLTSVYEELKELSKKKQDGLLNGTKVKMTNKILVRVKAMLSDNPALEFLDLLDEETLPSNSDAVIIIAHYNSVLKQFRIKNSFYRSGTYHWKTEANYGKYPEMKPPF
jgi:hypothetical protein